MESANSVIEIVKNVGPIIWKYVKYQVYPNIYVGECQERKTSLQSRRDDINADLDSQLTGLGKIPKQEVKDWLEKVRKETESIDDDQFDNGGCFCNICQSKHCDERAQELKRIFDEGVMYTNPGSILVQDDPLIMKQHSMSTFEETKGSLRRRKQDVESMLHGQLRFRKIEKDEVKHWLETVEKQIETAEDEVQKDVILPPSRKLLDEKIRELSKLFEEGKEFTYPDAILVKDDPATIRGIPLQAERCYGRDTAQEEILKCLKGHEVMRIAVWGMGGVGKTTLIKQIHNQLLKESKFDKVIWITVSKDLNILRIQNEIVKQLNEVPLEEDDATRRAALMSAMLGRGSYLLILDDVWDAFSAEEVGFSADSHSKIVLTTRSKDVARQTDCNMTIELKPLSSAEALQLFLEKVGGAVLSADGNIKPDLKSAVTQIVEECHGIPLAIVTVASTMKGKPERYAWVKALKQLQEASKIVFAGEKGPMGILKFSYDRLEDKILQDCFLYCALYPEDTEIKKRELIENWIGEGFIDDQMGTWDEMICEGLQILRKLQDNCLLECIQYEDKYGTEFLGKKISEVDDETVKMHDLLRDMALDISTSSHRCFVKGGLREEELRKKKEWAANVEKVSFMRRGMQEIPLTISDLKYDMLTTLLMRGNNIVTIPESFFSQMPRLKVLDLSWNRQLSSLPNSLSNLENLTTLLLQLCIRLKEVPSLSKCQALTKLNLSCSGIIRVPEGMEMLLNLICLDLWESNIYQIPKGILPKLPNLQSLTGPKMDVEEVITLKKLEYVCVKTESVDEVKMVLRFMQNQVKSLLQLETPLILCKKVERDDLFFDLRLDGKTICSVNLVYKLEILAAAKFVRSGKVVCYKSIQECYRFLDHIQINEVPGPWMLSIRHNELIEGVFNSWFERLQTLETLEILSENVKYVFDEKALGLPMAPPVSSSFFSLKRIRIHSCPELKRLFSPSLLLDYLQNLEYISVESCKTMEAIISSSCEEEAIQKLTLPKLKTLKLKGLPALKSICSSSSSVLVCDSLETLEIDRCDELKRFPFYFPQLDNAQPSLPPLKSIKISLSVFESAEWVHVHPSAKDILRMNIDSAVTNPSRSY